MSSVICLAAVTALSSASDRCFVFLLRGSQDLYSSERFTISRAASTTSVRQNAFGSSMFSRITRARLGFRISIRCLVGLAGIILGKSHTTRLERCPITWGDGGEFSGGASFSNSLERGSE
eukprot:CAMPEP_0184686508 /NCGR_PEP_ID=MMETSP0312-20130426/22750_1 /TAXON_ID=31354 /ORGANISM="Compsopogon coeruleus, Strain SAG 36.94" /LENGTH=119 /DNA_ID=CAMNT_0027141667 /DNA_START=153 /DNA_END=509 /DNA_ORIENTATION=+